MSERRLNDELASIEAALGSLTPVASGVGRDRVMFLAGRASAERFPPAGRRRLAAWLWPCVTSASLLAAAAMGVFWVTGGRPEIVERVVYVPAAGPAATLTGSASARSSTAFADWQPAPLVRGRGVDALPPPRTTPDRRAPKSSERGSQSHAVEAIT